MNETKQGETMKHTMTTHEIADALKSDDNANWSWNGAKALAEWLEELEEDTGEEMEFDRVAIRCDFSEYASLAEWAKDYYAEDCWQDIDDLDIEADASEEEIDDAIREHLQENTMFIEFEGGVIVQAF